MFCTLCGQQLGASGGNGKGGKRENLGWLKTCILDQLERLKCTCREASEERVTVVKFRYD